MINRWQLPEIIKQARLAHGLSQRALARIIGVSNQAIKMWEEGVSAPSRIYLKRLASALGLELQQFYEDIDEG